MQAYTKFCEHVSKMDFGMLLACLPGQEGWSTKVFSKLIFRETHFRVNLKKDMKKLMHEISKLKM